MKHKGRKLDTLLIHAGEPDPRIQGSVSMPVFLSSTFEYNGDGTAGYDAVRYARLSNTPNHAALHANQDGTISLTGLERLAGNPVGIDTETAAWF